MRDIDMLREEVKELKEIVKRDTIVEQYKGDLSEQDSFENLTELNSKHRTLLSQVN